MCEHQAQKDKGKRVIIRGNNKWRLLEVYFTSAAWLPVLRSGSDPGFQPLDGREVLVSCLGGARVPGYLRVGGSGHARLDTPVLPLPEETCLHLENTPPPHTLHMTPSHLAGICMRSSFFLLRKRMLPADGCIVEASIAVNLN